MVAKVVCISNLKGGVGKTTLTMALAEYLAGDIYSKRVLVIDLDPQCNLTSALMNEDIWEEFENKCLTIPYLFQHPDLFLKRYKDNEFIAKSGISSLRKNCSFKCLHFIPNSARMFEVQENLINQNYFFSSLKPVNLLQELLKPLLSKYDYILIDCPPTLNHIIRSAFLASDFCLIPCVPNKMSIHGLELVLEHIEKSNKIHGHNLKALGIIISRYNGTSAQTASIKFIKENPLFPEVFDAEIRERSKIAQALDYGGQVTYKQKYGESHDDMSALANEFIQKVG